MSKITELELPADLEYGSVELLRIFAVGEKGIGIRVFAADVWFDDASVQGERLGRVVRELCTFDNESTVFPNDKALRELLDALHKELEKMKKCDDWIRAVQRRDAAEGVAQRQQREAAAAEADSAPRPLMLADATD